MKPQKFKAPPTWPGKLLGWLVAPHLREEVLGDFHERYARRVERVGEVRGPKQVLAGGAGVPATEVYQA